MKIHEKYILRCIELGKNGLGTVAPNPMVGSVLVSGERIIGEGYTSAYGGPHAEVNAINAVTEKDLLSGATMYVTLEPCSHYGKTPPCTDSIIKYRIPRVVIGTGDPHEKVAGRGIGKLREAGCEVITGVLSAECREHHKRFLTYHEQKRPYVILKWAESFDGFIAPEEERRTADRKPFWISGTPARQMVHQWRSQEQAILAGTNTVLRDNPQLTTRYWKGASPVRIILDKGLRVPETHAVLDRSIETLVLTEITDATRYLEGIGYERIDYHGDVPRQVMKVLFQRHITSVIVEGGARTLASFIDSGLWDEARIFKAKSMLRRGIKAPGISGRLADRHRTGEDELYIVRNDQEYYI